MVMLDSNIFVIDRFFRNDALYPPNRVFVERLSEFECAISIFTLLETAGVASFNLSAKECEGWLHRFPSIYPIMILSASCMESESAEEWLKGFVDRVTSNITRRMNFGDAILLSEAEGHHAEALITWNTKDFARRASVPVLSPKVFIESRKERHK